MIWNFMVCLALVTFPCFDCKHIDTNPNTEKTVTISNKITKLQNETTALQKNSTFEAQKNETVGKHDILETKHKPKVRQVQTDVPLVPTPVNNMNVEQSYYPSPLMVYPFPMMNTYYPRYFPYIYPGNQGNHFFG